MTIRWAALRSQRCSAKTYHTFCATGTSTRIGKSTCPKADLMAMELTRNVQEFWTPANNFVMTNLKDHQAFVMYFYVYYYKRTHMWAKVFRNFFHAFTNTHMYCESFHNNLKSHYLKRRLNKRLDDLIKVLLEIERETFLNFFKESHTSSENLAWYFNDFCQYGPKF